MALAKAACTGSLSAPSLGSPGTGGIAIGRRLGFIRRRHIGECVCCVCICDARSILYGPWKAGKRKSVTDILKGIFLIKMCQMSTISRSGKISINCIMSGQLSFKRIADNMNALISRQASGYAC